MGLTVVTAMCYDTHMLQEELPVISLKLMENVFEYVELHGVTQASEYFNVAEKTIKRYLQLYSKHNNNGMTERSDGSVVVSSDMAPAITNVAEAMDYGKLNPAKWKPHRVDYNARADGKLQFKAAFVPIPDVDIVLTPVEYANQFSAFVREHKTPVFIREKLKRSGILATISAADWHHGKQVWAAEISGSGENWDIHESRDTFAKYISYAKEVVRRDEPDTVVIELLGDWFNVDSPSNSTVAGTVQSEDSRFIKTQSYAENMLIDAIESVHEIANNVKLLIVPGNHDATRILLLGRFIQAYYRNDDTVEVLCDPTTRKKIRWGNTLLGYSHEMKGNVVQNMFSLWPQDCGECTDLIMNTGHLHTRKDMRPTIEYQQSVKVVQHPAMVPEDAWSSGEGYYHKREALIRVFDIKLGQIAEYAYRPYFN